ncbi:MAG: hypothetical protein JWM59_2651 [Verrucomicrobiales bacterium]|nr:hypothetical protein [Verrucomicrobiales bacterium]
MGIQQGFVRGLAPGVLLSCLAMAAEKDGPTVSTVPPMPASSAELNLHQRLTEAWQTGGIDLRHSDAVFAWVFRHLPDEVTVYPTENYYYWRLTTGGREIRGNFRPASGEREKGILSFAYTEWREFPDDLPENPDLTRVRRFSAEDGVTVKCPDPLTCDVSSEGKTVRFHLHDLPQLPPASFPPALEEVFVERTWDESGLPFFLCFHRAAKCFFWVLNEEKPVAEVFTETAPGIFMGRRTGFYFWRDAACGNRKILAAVRGLSVRRNDYFDGPFDQLADNYAAQVPLRKYLAEAFPAIAGEIDLHGYFTSGPDKGNRVALTSHLMYDTAAQAMDFIRRAAESPVPVAAIAAGGKDR